MTRTKLTAQKREVTGRKVSALRKEALIPANIYGNNVESLSIQIDIKAFEAAYKVAHETGVIDLDVDGDIRPVLVDEVQVHPVSDEILHVTLRQVNLKEKITANVPFEFIGEAPAEKIGLIVVEQMNEVEVEALPTDLPEFIEVDLSVLIDAESSISIADLKVPADVEIKAEAEQIVANVSEPQKEEVIEESAPAEVEIISEKKEETSESQAE